ncbi:MAG: hypothetical protein IKC59_05805 [Clostridia bacterium]|nr:hypothetical protein [Clostridia bacterium]
MICNIKDFGAIGDSTTLNTQAIQKAIDVCFENGGGQVLVTDGTYMFGTIILRSDVELHIAANATLLGSPKCEDYPERADVKHVDSKKLPRWRNACYIYCEDSENVSITGMGTIDCNGGAFVEPEEKQSHWKYKRIDAPTPPRVVFFAGCKNVRIEHVTMINQPAGWSYWIHDCDRVSFDHVKIFAEVEYPNNDGIHINSSRNVTISNCDITCGDDCLVVRANNASLPENKVCEKVSVTNCNLTSYSGGIRIGWKNCGVIRNCTFSNLVMTDTSVGIDIHLPHFTFDPTKMYIIDCGREATLIENISFDNIMMDNVYAEPVKILIHDDPETKVEAIRNLYFSNIHARGPRGISLKGRAQNRLDNIRFSNCTFEVTDYSAFSNQEYHGAQVREKSHGGFPKLVDCDRVVFDHVEFQVKN